MSKIKLCDVVLDFSLYPRQDVDSTNVSRLREAFLAGVNLPPPLLDRGSKRVADGFHRITMYRRELAADAEVDVVLKDYADDAAIYCDAVRLNLSHGKPLSPIERAKAGQRLRKFGMKIADVAELLHVRPETLKAVAERRIAKDPGGGSMILKSTIAFKRGQTLTAEQVTVNDALSGMNQVFTVNQIIMLIEADLVDMENVELMKRLAVLHERLGALVGAVAVA